jgi:hypothetical protein
VVYLELFDALCDAQAGDSGAATVGSVTAARRHNVDVTVHGLATSTTCGGARWLVV